MKALVGTFNEEKALVGAFSVIVKTDCETDESYAALVSFEESPVTAVWRLLAPPGT